MSNKRPIPPVETREYADSGELVIRPALDKKSIVIEVHYCTIYLSEHESMQVALSLLQAGLKLYGIQWLGRLIAYVEKW